jgi:DNA-3-methyladenine glycosylase
VPTIEHSPDVALSASFFERRAAKVARELLGKQLVRCRGNATRTFVIVETEAYGGPQDLASHASRGRTPRTEVMFGPAGHFYVYRIYGLHWILNVVTGPVGDAGAVLIRSVAGIEGPGRVTAGLAVNGGVNGRKADPVTGLWFAPNRAPLARLRVRTMPRVGVDYAGPVWSRKKLRFILR